MKLLDSQETNSNLSRGRDVLTFSPCQALKTPELLDPMTSSGLLFHRLGRKAPVQVKSEECPFKMNNQMCFILSSRVDDFVQMHKHVQYQITSV